MTKPTDEQVRKFWGWCGLGCIHDWKYLEHTPLWGLDCVKCRQKYRSSQWGRGHAPIVGDLNDLPPIDLNSLFKYAVPKLERENLYTHIIFGYELSDPTNTTVQILFTGNQLLAESDDKDSALALFWALDQVREEKELK